MVTLEVATHPAGAKVTRLDSNQLLGVTPLKLQAEPATGPIGLRLELLGHQSVERQVTLTSNVSLSVDLPPEPKTSDDQWLANARTQVDR